ncbi:adenosylcobinamide-phosphate synthase CbiB [Dehalogenimonas alkenigignens]|uniref:Cobalamin biosynthesis protein CobD n=1 Tax=Dehalogenimonas alkenigignens TaxID=1217799 RepID=A0A0W0GJ94_9CHLR|nr:adenosylcobinamide-phosphate synthase CbiB [Dehalogenimonas alkenigignens]KTB48594.1 adenosylcobinamide-phosphate synthase [Dehalogenimonas alkenigignens]PVV84967.1 cobalamin biosynthesis protein CobD [Dehalogenimonas alkenigignens]
MDIILILLVALLVEFAIGDPPNAIHPTAWFGKVIYLFERFGLRGGKTYQFVYGTAATLLLAAVVAAAAWLLADWLRDINYALYIIASGVLLKMTFSFVYLRKTALHIKRLIENDETLDKARFELRALVSRDTSKLPRPYLVSATVESVSESLCDSLVSPLFFFVVGSLFGTFGLAAAFGFRVVSTFDSMIGYHGKYEYFGKFPARLDDVLNYIPARLSALVIIAGAWLTKMGARRAWRVAKVDHLKTESPNAGWPMAAAAGALGVQFEKIDHYRLGRIDRPMTPGVIDDSLRLINSATLVWFIICFAIGGAYIALAKA